MHTQNLPASRAMSYYVERWFIPFSALVRRSGGTPGQVRDLLQAGATAGVVYSEDHDGTWWSALGGFVGKMPPAPPANGVHWYAPASIYWLRRGLLFLREGLTPPQAAAANLETFKLQFSHALASEPLARFNYPDAFTGQDIDPAGAQSAAAREWAAWISGAYAVCLSSFTGQSCVIKESVGRFLRTQSDNRDKCVSDLQMLDCVERLSAWLMPFAPSERSSGTPGIAIDRVITEMRLGCEEPYGSPDDA